MLKIINECWLYFEWLNNYFNWCRVFIIGILKKVKYRVLCLLEVLEVKISKGMEFLVFYKVDYLMMLIVVIFVGFYDLSKLKFFNSGFGVIKMDEFKWIEVENVSVKDKVISYKECNRNYVIFFGGYVVDGCGEFMFSGEEGIIEFFKCVVCDCYRNYYRKEVEVEESCDW